MPVLVVIDQPETNAVAINQALAAWTATPILQNLPAAINPSANDPNNPTPFVWRFQTFVQANQFIGFMRGRINGIRILSLEGNQGVLTW